MIPCFLIRILLFDQEDWPTSQKRNNIRIYVLQVYKSDFFFFLWLHWVFVAAHGLSLVAARGTTLCCAARASHCGGFSCCGAPALGAWAVEHRLSSCDSQAQLLCGMWDLPGPGIESMYLALAGRLLTTAPPGKSLIFFKVFPISYIQLSSGNKYPIYLQVEYTQEVTK